MTAIQTLKTRFDRLRQRAFRIPTSASWLTTLTTGSAPTKKSTVIVTASMIGRKVPEKVLASALALVARLVCSRALVCLLFPVWVRWLPPAGWLAATAVGAAAGAATGGLVGALTEAGVSKEEAPLYAEGVRRGGTLVSARVAESDRARLDALLDQSSVNLRDRSAAWQKTGWKTYDPASKPYGAEEVRKERQLYTGGI
jgi:hypothetical protein